MCCPEDELRPDLSGIERDPRYEEVLAPWDGEEATPERGDDGLHYWTDWAPPVEGVVGLQAIVSLLQEKRPDGVIVMETGVGQGYLTRRLGQMMRRETDLYWCYEQDHAWRMQLSVRDQWVTNYSTCLKDYPTPTYDEYMAADLVIVDSNKPMAEAEFYMWASLGRPGSLLVSRSSHEGSVPLSVFGPPIFYLHGDDLGYAEIAWSTTFEHSRVGV